MHCYQILEHFATVFVVWVFPRWSVQELYLHDVGGFNKDFVHWDTLQLWEGNLQTLHNETNSGQWTSDEGKQILVMTVVPVVGDGNWWFRGERACLVSSVSSIGSVSFWLSSCWDNSHHHWWTQAHIERLLTDWFESFYMMHICLFNAQSEHEYIIHF